MVKGEGGIFQGLRWKRIVCVLFFDSEGKEERKEYYSAEGDLQGYSEFEYDNDADVPPALDPLANQLIRENTFWNTGSDYSKLYDLDQYFRENMDTCNAINGDSYNKEYSVSRTEYSIYRYDEELRKEQYEKYGDGYPISGLFYKMEWLLSVDAASIR